MSEPVSALKNASDVTGIADISEIGPQGMITLRGDLANKALIEAATVAGAAAMPGLRECSISDTGGLAWMSPDELLVLCPYAQVSTRLTALQDALKGTHALAVNVSDARALFELTGPHVREVIAKLAPVDMHPDQFAPGTIRRTRFAQVPAAFWLQDAQTARIICFRSVAQYMFDLLKVAAQPGSEVGAFAPSDAQG